MTPESILPWKNVYPCIKKHFNKKGVTYIKVTSTFKAAV